jgi:iron(II)-dependent oxidoreductase
MSQFINAYSAAQLIDRLADARARLRALIACLPDSGWLGPKATHLNPPLWEYGHIVWFQERWCLRAQPDGSRSASLCAAADALYDSSNVAHDTRWTIPLLPPEAVDDYASKVADAIATRLSHDFDDDLAYYAELCIYHELMHIEAWWMAFQDLGYAPPAPLPAVPAPHAQRLHFAAGEVQLGSAPDSGFIFDNEKWPHRVAHAAFDIDSVALSEAVFMAFIDANGYRKAAYWSDDGLVWLTQSGVRQPRYWRKRFSRWQVRSFDQWHAPRADTPMRHINRYEAAACAAWLRRQLPNTAQWLCATQSPEFIRGEVWEWMNDAFAPYPGFAPDPYHDYSEPWFYSHWELRGGGPVTDPQLKRPGFRNFYLPHRRDAFAGFRTVCAAD